MDVKVERKLSFLCGFFGTRLIVLFVNFPDYDSA